MHDMAAIRHRVTHSSAIDILIKEAGIQDLTALCD